MSGPKKTLPPPPPRLASTLRNIARLLNSSPVSWDDVSDVTEKIILVGESYELLALLRDEKVKKEGFGKKMALGKTIFTWLQHILKNPALETSPAKLNLSVFHDPIYADIPVNVPLLGGTAYATETPSDDLANPGSKEKLKDANDDDGQGKDERGEEEAGSWDARQVPDSDYHDSDEADSDEDSEPAKKRKASGTSKKAASGPQKRPRVDTDAEGQPSKKAKAGDAKRPDGAFSPPTPCDNCASKSLECRANKEKVACNPCIRKRQPCSLSVRTRNKRSGAQANAKDQPPKDSVEARIISTNSLDVEDGQDRLPSRATSVSSTVSSTLSSPKQTSLMSPLGAIMALESAVPRICTRQIDSQYPMSQLLPWARPHPSPPRNWLPMSVVQLVILTTLYSVSQPAWLLLAYAMSQLLSSVLCVPAGI